MHISSVVTKDIYYSKCISVSTPRTITEPTTHIIPATTNDVPTYVAAKHVKTAVIPASDMSTAAPAEVQAKTTAWTSTTKIPATNDSLSESSLITKVRGTNTDFTGIIMDDLTAHIDEPITPTTDIQTKGTDATMITTSQDAISMTNTQTSITDTRMKSLETEGQIRGTYTAITTTSATTSSKTEIRHSITDAGTTTALATSSLTTLGGPTDKQRTTSTTIGQ
jgi:hypothetical protein